MEKPMASEGRDRNFDKALARHLRSAAASKEAANLSAGAASQGGACPDSEILAAYHERSLLPEEMNSWKEHIVGCTNCQTILTQLEATDEIPLQAAAKDKVLSAKDSELVLAAPQLETSPELPAPSDNRRVATATLPAKSRRAQLLRGARWQWLAPAGALAAGLLLWVAWHENKAPSLPVPASIKIAANEPASAPSPPAQPALAPSPVPASISKPQSVLDDRTRASSRAELDSLKQRQSADFGAIAAPTKRDADREGGARKDAVLGAPANLPLEPTPGDLDAKLVGGAVQEKVELQAQAANVQTQNAQSQNQYNNVAPKVSGPAPLGQAEAAKKMKAAASPAPRQEAASGGVAGFNAAASTELVAVSNPRLISPPGSSVMWRVGRAGLVEYSKDGGSSWSRQTSGVLVDLSTGTALSDKVCWIVGRVGAILLTTDGGEHWKSVASPIAEDLGGVHAADALHATIWNARNTKTFETSDGGLTWKRIIHP
jgi:hypothetical protein